MVEGRSLATQEEYPRGIQPPATEFFTVVTRHGERRVTGTRVEIKSTPVWPPELSDEQIALGGG